MNKPLTPEEAKNLNFPCLLEVWDDERFESRPVLVLVKEFKREHFFSLINTSWPNAALPSPEIFEAMRKQLGAQSEYPKRMLVWDDNESNARPRIVIADLGEKAKSRYIVVTNKDEEKFQKGQQFDWYYYRNSKPIPEPNPIAQEIAELRQRLADLEAKQNQQS